MAERGGVAAPNQKQKVEPTEPAIKSTTATTKSGSSRTTTAFTYKLVKF